jgi:hypothetical protein
LSQGLDLVFDTSGHSVSSLAPVVLHANPKFDFTQVVLEKLNAGRPPGGAGDAPAATPPKEPIAEPATKPALGK